MTALLLVVVSSLALAVVGALVDGLFWLTLVGLALFLVSAALGAARGPRPGPRPRPRTPARHTGLCPGARLTCSTPTTAPWSRPSTAARAPSGSAAT